MWQQASGDKRSRFFWVKVQCIIMNPLRLVLFLPPITLDITVRHLKQSKMEYRQIRIGMNSRT